MLPAFPRSIQMQFSSLLRERFCLQEHEIFWILFARAEERENPVSPHSTVQLSSSIPYTLLFNFLSLHTLQFNSLSFFSLFCFILSFAHLTVESSSSHISHPTVQLSFSTPHCSTFSLFPHLTVEFSVSPHPNVKFCLFSSHSFLLVIRW